jgi:ATP-dependent exoDNAse (exonuclease V) beta subunit
LAANRKSHDAAADDAEKAELDRERIRLWYVATTRARECWLCLGWPSPQRGSNWKLGLPKCRWSAEPKALVMSKMTADSTHSFRHDGAAAAFISFLWPKFQMRGIGEAG